MRISQRDTIIAFEKSIDLQYGSPGIWGSGVLSETGRSIQGIQNEKILVNPYRPFLSICCYYY